MNCGMSRWLIAAHVSGLQDFRTLGFYGFKGLKHELSDIALADGSTHEASALRSARFPVNLIGSPINHANRLIGSSIISQSTA